MPSTTGFFHSEVERGTSNGVISKLIFPFNFSELSRLPKISLLLNCNNTLVNWEIPAAPSRCPIFDLTDPILQYCLSALVENASVSASISIGSPNDVPVPCAST